MTTTIVKATTALESESPVRRWKGMMLPAAARQKRKTTNSGVKTGSGVKSGMGSGSGVGGRSGSGRQMNLCHPSPSSDYPPLPVPHHPLILRLAALDPDLDYDWRKVLSFTLRLPELRKKQR